MNQGDGQDPTGVPEPWQPRFSLAAMLMVMLVLAVVSAAAGYLVQALGGSGPSKFSFILFTLAAPALTLVAVSVIWGVVAWLAGRGRR